MTRSSARYVWLPRFTAGFAGAVGAEMAVALLLYIGGGFFGALSLLLVVEMAGLGAGLWSAPRDAAPPWAGVRRAWFIMLLTFVAAAGVAAGWEALGGLANSWLARGMGLAFLAAMPLYGTGLVLGAPSLEEDGASATSRAAPALGAAAGFAMVGLGRMSLMVAPFSYVTAVLAISLGALSQTRRLAEKEALWREWAERGTARDDLAPPVPRAAMGPIPDALRPRPQPPIAPGAPR